MRPVSASRSQRKSTSLSHLSYPPERKSLYDKTIQDVQPSLYKRNIPAPLGENGGETNRSQLLSSNPGMSFIEVTESQYVPAETPQEEDSSPTLASDSASQPNVADASLSRKLRKQERLFAILSSHSDIDHPVCSECSVMLVSAFNARLASATRERDAYASFLKALQQTSPRSSDDTSARKELDLLAQEEDETLTELVKLEQEKKELEAELLGLEEETRQLDSREEQFWKSRNTFDDRMHDLEVDLISLQQKYAHDQQQLERLQRTNVYNDTFCIGHDGYFGTINGLRLGRLPNQNVEWAEINAAWGQTLLLLATVAERLNFNFQGYRLRPLGSTSRIDKLEWLQQSPDVSRVPSSRQPATANPPPKTTQLDLFSSGDMPLGRVFNHRRFDAGMVAFLDCLSQIGSYVEKSSKVSQMNLRVSPSKNTRSGNLVLPYTVDGDKIGGVSIRLGVGFSQDENFTKACKYALTCCKFLLAHVSNLETSKGV